MSIQSDSWDSQRRDCRWLRYLRALWPTTAYPTHVRRKASGPKLPNYSVQVILEHILHTRNLQSKTWQVHNVKLVYNTQLLMQWMRTWLALRFKARRRGSFSQRPVYSERFCNLLSDTSSDSSYENSIVHTSTRIRLTHSMPAWAIWNRSSTINERRESSERSPRQTSRAPSWRQRCGWRCAWAAAKWAQASILQRR